MMALQISPEIERLDGLGRPWATKLKGFVFATLARLPFGQFSTENSQTWLGSKDNITELVQSISVGKEGQITCMRHKGTSKTCDKEIRLGS